MIRVAIAIVLILFFYNFVAIGDGATTQLSDLSGKSWSSTILAIIILYISTNWWAYAIALIEGLLLLVNLHIAAFWATASVFDPYYVQIQYTACVLELLILCVATLEAAKNGRTNNNPDFNQFKSRDLMRSGRS